MLKRKSTLTKHAILYILPLACCLLLLMAFTGRTPAPVASSHQLALHLHVPTPQPALQPWWGPSSDTDGDGVLDATDVDDDNDGITDLQESVTGLDPFGDANSNTVPNYQDNTMAGWVDANTDGIDDRYDTDRDGIINSYDRDTDGDGIPDVLEAGLPDVDDDAKTDGPIGANGLSIAVAGMPGFTPRNTDTDPIPDFRDIDSDADGITDNVEGQFTNQYILPTGADTDQDGIDNAYDKDNNTFYNHQGIIPVNFQGAVDALPDYIDIDADDDGRPDIVEGHDGNLDNVADFSPTGIDSDGDGLDDGFDLDLTSPNIKNAGMDAVSMFGFGNPPADPPGTLGCRGPLQRSLATDLDRSWRNFFSGSILPLTLVKFTAEKQTDKIMLNWQSTNEANFREYVLERSHDGITFSAIATIPGKGGLSALYNYADNLPAAATARLLYRLKQIDNNSRSVYSRILFVTLNKINGISFKMAPNPASDNVTLSISSDKKLAITIHVFDNLGRLLLTQRTGIASGDNVIPLIGANTLQKGNYHVVINTGTEKITQKLLIQQ